MCPGGWTGLARTEGVYRGGARCEAGEVPETQVWILRWHAMEFGHHLCSREPLTVLERYNKNMLEIELAGKGVTFSGQEAGMSQPCFLKNKHPLFQQKNLLSLQHRYLLGFRNHRNPVALESHHKAQSCHHFLATGYNQLGHSWGPRCPGGMGWIHDRLHLQGIGLDLVPSMGWDSAEAPQTALGLGRVLEGELVLEVNKVLGAHRAVDMDVTRENHAALAWDRRLRAGLDVVPDTDRVPNVAVVEDMDGDLTLHVVLGVDMAVEQDVDMNVGQEVGIAAVISLDFGPVAVVDRRLGVDVTLHVASAPGRRHPRKVVGHNSQSSV